MAYSYIITYLPQKNKRILQKLDLRLRYTLYFSCDTKNEWTQLDLRSYATRLFYYIILHHKMQK